MSTRSRIAKLNEDNTVTSIYCHFDGYLEGVGKTLIQQYPLGPSDILKAGDIRTLPDRIKDVELLGCGEAARTESLSEFCENWDSWGEEYGYLYKDNSWHVTQDGRTFLNIEK